MNENTKLARGTLIVCPTCPSNIMVVERDLGASVMVRQLDHPGMMEERVHKFEIELWTPEKERIPA